MSTKAERIIFFASSKHRSFFMNTTFISRGLNFSIAHGNPFQPHKNVADGYNALTILFLRQTFTYSYVLLLQLHKLLC